MLLLGGGQRDDDLKGLLFVSGHVHDMAVNEWGHAVLCTALSVIDDTALVGKSIVSELKVMSTMMISRLVVLHQGFVILLYNILTGLMLRNGLMMTNLSTGGLISLMSVDIRASPSLWG